MNVFEISLNRIAKARHARGDRARTVEEAAEDAAAAKAEDDSVKQSREAGVHSDGGGPRTRSRTKGATATAEDSSRGHQAASNRGRPASDSAHCTKRSQFLDVHYRPLCDDPLGTVETIYRHFGMQLSTQARANMERWIAHVSRYITSVALACYTSALPFYHDTATFDAVLNSFTAAAAALLRSQNPQNKGMYGKTRHQLEWTGFTADQIEQRCQRAADPLTNFPEPYR